MCVKQLSHHAPCVAAPIPPRSGRLLHRPPLSGSLHSRADAGSMMVRNKTLQQVCTPLKREAAGTAPLWEPLVLTLICVIASPFLLLLLFALLSLLLLLLFVLLLFLACIRRQRRMHVERVLCQPAEPAPGPEEMNRSSGTRKACPFPTWQPRQVVYKFRHEATRQDVQPPAPPCSRSCSCRHRRGSLRRRPRPLQRRRLPRGRGLDAEVLLRLLRQVSAIVGFYRRCCCSRCLPRCCSSSCYSRSSSPARGGSRGRIAQLHGLGDGGPGRLHRLGSCPEAATIIVYGSTVQYCLKPLLDAPLDALVRRRGQPAAAVRAVLQTWGSGVGQVRSFQVAG